MGFTLIGEETTWSATLGLALDEGIFSQSKKTPFYFIFKCWQIDLLFYMILIFLAHSYVL